MRVYPAILALSGLSKAEREPFGYEVAEHDRYKPTCQRCLHPMEESETLCAVCGAPCHFAFCGVFDRDGKTVADFPDLRAIQSGASTPQISNRVWEP